MSENTIIGRLQGKITDSDDALVFTVDIIDLVKEKAPFKAVLLVLSGILMACAIYPPLVLKWIDPFWGGVGLLLFVDTPHIVGFILSVMEKDTRAGLVIFLFTCFWTLLGISLQLPFYLGLDEIATFKFHMNLKMFLIFVEFGMAVIIFSLQLFYKGVKLLRPLLNALGTTVAILLLCKLSQVSKLNHLRSASDETIIGIISDPSTISAADIIAAVSVWILGIWTAIVFVKLIKQSR